MSRYMITQVNPFSSSLEQSISYLVFSTAIFMERYFFLIMYNLAKTITHRYMHEKASANA